MKTKDPFPTSLHIKNVWKIDLTQLTKTWINTQDWINGKPQNGFKRKHTIATASLTLQSLLASALDDDKYPIMASLDLSVAFDVVNIELLLKSLQIIGISNDLVELISKWIKDRYFYVSLNVSY